MAELFELEELASALQQDLDTATATLARELATGAVQTACRQNLLLVTDEELILPVDWPLSVIELPERPVVSITSVERKRFRPTETWIAQQYLPGVGVLWPFNALPIGNGPEGGDNVPDNGTSWPSGVYRIVYTHGWDQGDPALRLAKGIAIAAALRVYDNPENVRAEAVADVSRTLANETLSSLLTEREQADLRRRYGGGGARSIRFG